MLLVFFEIIKLVQSVEQCKEEEFIELIINNYIQTIRKVIE